MENSSKNEFVSERIQLVKALMSIFDFGLLEKSEILLPRDEYEEACTASLGRKQPNHLLSFR